MVSFAPTSDETLEDQRLYTQARLTKVACLDCLAQVGVKKNSEHHTSIQWGAESLAACAEFQRTSSEPGGRHVYASCSRLRSSIDRAVAEGEIEIGALDGY
jgi:post-segregation antitoxin (ccd killing protein)